MGSTLRWSLLPIRRFDEFAGDWDVLNDAGSASPALTSGIFSIALRAFGVGDEQLAIARVDSRIVAMALLCRPSSVRIRTFQPAQLPLGAWVQSTDISFDEAARSLVRILPWPILATEVTQQDPIILPRPTEETGSSLSTGDYIETSGVDVAGSFDSYWSQRGSNLRQNVRKLHNKLIREGLKGSAKFITDGTEMVDAVDRYGELESRGWKGKEGTALHPGNEQGRFYREILNWYALDGAALVVEYHIGEALVCSNLCISRHGVLVILKTAHSETDARFSPATLLNYELFQYLFSSADCRRVEFYGRVMDWHRRYMSDSRWMYHVSVYRTPAVRAAAAAVRKWRAGRVRSIAV